MVKKVLIVDDDTEMLATLQSGLAAYDDTFTVLVAENGAEAIEILKNQVVSLVVTDLKMPRVDGFALLQHIMQHYPDIPVIVITGYSTAEMESMARKGGAVGYIAKPFMLETLARQILTALRRESEGGRLHSVSSGIFLQLIEMEQKTCTIRLEDKSSGRSGVLFFREGALLDARVGETQGKGAAYEIFTWDTVSIAIQNVCPDIPDRIQSELQALILESSRLKDESEENAAPVEAPETEAVDDPGPSTAESADAADRLQSVLKKDLGAAITGMRPVRSWQPLLECLRDIGNRLESGPLTVCYLNREDAGDVLLVPSSPPVEVGIKSRSPRDRLLMLVAAHSRKEARKTR